MKTSEIQFPDPAPFYKTYTKVLGEVELMQSMRNQLDNFPKFLESIPEEKFKYAYAEDKWTIAEAIHHIIDTERVFQYRALRFSRGDVTSLSGFDQDIFVAGANANKRSIFSLIKEYQIVRQSTIVLFEDFDDSILQQKGIASNLEWSVGALGFVICGHQKHHRNIIRERYL
jgi:hypothetical protein